MRLPAIGGLPSVGSKNQHSKFNCISWQNAKGSWQRERFNNSYFVIFTLSAAEVRHSLFFIQTYSRIQYPISNIQYPKDWISIFNDSRIRHSYPEPD
jgi:hypothetical protein